ncbi:hypothetical protein HYH03_011054 [Edaphochlamys debaryana]|uniref:Uncharacterized protein n=1 Tax=Edaphochlamys debaryana TaxID=47281 RepID=A0A835XWP9_9CHLO|nr:hypothetical protein HYH03_011054 [Edaphochlamys debaryana]|eukprot:KAG2490418.1 hypothetical protein HYH03_011054 [Edaphochlamys debaryana]
MDAFADAAAPGAPAGPAPAGPALAPAIPLTPEQVATIVSTIVRNLPQQPQTGSKPPPKLPRHLTDFNPARHGAHKILSWLCSVQHYLSNSDNPVFGALQGLCAHLRDTLSASDKTQPKTWEDLQDLLLKHCANPDIILATARALRRLRLHDNILEYISLYRQHDSLIGNERSEFDRVFNFCEGLDSKYRKKVYSNGRPATLEDAINICVNVHTSNTVAAFSPSHKDIKAADFMDTSAAARAMSRPWPHNRRRGARSPSRSPPASLSAILPLPRNVKCIGVEPESLSRRLASNRCGQCGSDSHKKYDCRVLAAKIAANPNLMHKYGLARRSGSRDSRASALSDRSSSSRPASFSSRHPSRSPDGRSSASPDHRSSDRKPTPYASRSNSRDSRPSFDRSNQRRGRSPGARR